VPPSRRIARPLVAAGAVFRDARGRVLLVHPTYKPGWEVPGGVVEPGESPAVACRRELREELGLDRAPGPLLSVDWTEGDGHDRLLFLFDGGALGDDEDRIVLGADELDRWAWVAPADLAAHLPPPLARRVGSTVAGAGPYLEHGLTVTTDAG
jgi:8-oxo-dGTP diphosphatase